MCENCKDTKKVKAFISVRRGVIEEIEVSCPVCQKEQQEQEEKKQQEETNQK